MRAKAAITTAAIATSILGQGAGVSVVEKIEWPPQGQFPMGNNNQCPSS